MVLINNDTNEPEIKMFSNIPALKIKLRKRGRNSCLGKRASEVLVMLLLIGKKAIKAKEISR